MGQAIRAHGQGLQVFFAQFMKLDVGAGEQRMLRQILGDAFFPGGAGFFRSEKERAIHRKHVEKTLSWCESALQHADMLIMDEALYALGCGLLTEAELRDVIATARAQNVHLVLSGRGLPGWLKETADLITEMLEIRHPAQRGGKALKGIEF